MSLSSLAKTEIKLPGRRGRTKQTDPAPSSRRRRAARRSPRSTDAGTAVGLDIQPGEVVAAEVRLEGQVAIQRAVVGEIDHNLVREGEITDPAVLGAWLKEFFAEHRLPHRVRLGITSKRAVMRMIDLPPLTEAADITAAVQLQAPEHIPMPLDRAVLDHQVVGTVETANGPRTRVVVVAAHRDSVDRLLETVQQAGLQAVGVDLSAFALTRAMYSPTTDHDAPVLYAHVAGLTTVAIARGTSCELTRVSPVGLERLAGKLAERDGVTITEAYSRLLGFDPTGEVDEIALSVLDTGLAELADDLEKTIGFHATQSDGPPVVETVITGSAATIPNFTEVLGQRMRSPVRRGAPAADVEGLDAERAALAAGLAIEDVRS